MATFTNTSKAATASVANVARSAGTIYSYPKPGEGVAYDSPNVYDEDFDVVSGNPAFYDGSGTAPTYSNIQKS